MAAVFWPLGRFDNAFGTIAESGVSHGQWVHELGLLLSPAIQGVAAIAVTVAIAVVSAGEFGLAGVVAGD
jgi:hypothetical protein